MAARANAVPSLVNIAEDCSDHIHMVIRTDPSGEGQPDIFFFRVTVFPGLGVTVRHQCPDLCTPDSSFEIKFNNESLCDDFFPGHFAEESAGINVNSMSSCAVAGQSEDNEWDMVRILFEYVFEDICNLYFP